MIGRLKGAGLFGWLAAAFVGVGAVASLAVLLVVLPTLESSVRSDRENRQAREVTAALSTAGRSAELGLAFSPSRQEQLVTRLEAQLNGQVRLWRTDGELVAEAGPGYLPPGVNDVVRGALQFGSPIHDLRDLAGQRIVHAAAPVAGGGVLEAAAPIDADASELGIVRRRVFLSIVAVLLLAAFAGFALSRFLVGRIGALARTAATLAAGDLSARARGSSPRELSTLGDSLNSMAERLDALVAETRAERDRAQSLVAALAEGVLAVGADGEVTVANDAARRYLGLAPGEAARLDDLPPPVAESVRRVLGGGRGQLAAEVALPTGTELALTVSALRDQAAGAVVTLRDVTEDRRLERARRDLVANVSHELKTPLAAIRGFLELMEDPGLPVERRGEFLELMSLEAARLERLVEEQLELARLDAGALPLELEASELGAVAECVGESRAALAERDGVRLHVDVPDDPVPVLVDSARIEQIAFILVDNALRHTPRGGRITLTVRGHGDTATLAVTDTGEGIPAAAQPFVFDRFYQADGAREGAGAGLGLAIARGLARAHGGDIGVTSVPGIGSSFTLRLPIVRPVAPVEPVPDGASAGAGAQAPPPASPRGR
ncbi:MAG: ATP-binding protein [Actinomycetota bacterium]